MARSAHAYVRGSTRHFYEWLIGESGHKLPDGPPIWICGDCHAGNLGPVASADGKIEIQIRDLDQTVVGNPTHDLIRLGLSLATAARGSDLPGVTTALMLEHMMEGYEASMKAGKVQKSAHSSKELRPIETMLRQSVKREWRHLAQEQIGKGATSLEGSRMLKQFELQGQRDAAEAEVAAVQRDDGRPADMGLYQLIGLGNPGWIHVAVNFRHVTLSCWSSSTSP